MSCLTKAACSVMLKSPECYNNALLKLNYTEMEQCLNFNTAKAQTNKKKTNTSNHQHFFCLVYPLVAVWSEMCITL